MRPPTADGYDAGWLVIEPVQGETLRRALERRLRDAIVSGALREGVRLPASRALAKALGVSRGVVSEAYGQLEAQGFIVIPPRRAPVVATTVAMRASEAPPPPATAASLYDLTPTSPDVALFPLGRWLRAMQAAARRNGTATLDYRDPRGERALREALAGHLGRTRGVIAEPHQIVVVQGTAQGLDLILRVLLARRAGRLAVEDPSHATQHERARALGFRLCPQPVDDDGIVVAGLDADAALVTPAHQFPTGSVMSGERRRDLLAWCARGERFVIEDDYDSEFRYDRSPVRALQGLAPERVLHLGTVSKTLAPALRLGWVVAPRDIAEAVARAKRLADDFSPVLEQLALAQLIASGDYDRHLRRARAVYRNRRDALSGALIRHLPELRVEGVAAGIHVLVRLPSGVSDTTVADALAAEGVRVSALSAHRLTRAGGGGLVLGYARLHESAAEPAVEHLARTIRRHLTPLR